MLAANGINASPAHTNDPTVRRDAVANLLTTLTITGEPALVISPTCTVLVKGMSGRYRLKRLKVVGDERYQDKPDKNEFSHVCEALQYGVLGAGGDAQVLGNDWGSDGDLPSLDYAVI